MIALTDYNNYLANQINEETAKNELEADIRFDTVMGKAIEKIESKNEVAARRIRRSFAIRRMEEDSRDSLDIECDIIKSFYENQIEVYIDDQVSLFEAISDKKIFNLFDEEVQEAYRAKAEYLLTLDPSSSDMSNLKKWFTLGSGLAAKYKTDPNSYKVAVTTNDVTDRLHAAAGKIVRGGEKTKRVFI